MTTGCSDFLAYSRPPAPRRRLTNVQRILNDTLALARETLESAGIGLVTDLEEELPLLNVDGDMIREVFLNRSQLTARVLSPGAARVQLAEPALQPRRAHERPDGVQRHRPRHSGRELG